MNHNNNLQKMKAFENNKIGKEAAKTIYGGREVIRSEGRDSGYGTCVSDKMIIRNNGSVRVVLKSC